MLKPVVAYIEQGRGFGGAVSVLANALPFVRRRGYETHVVLTYEDARAADALAGRCDHIHVLPYRRRPVAVMERLEALNGRSRLGKWAYLLGLTLRESAEACRWLSGLQGLLRRVRPAVVHANNGPEYNRLALLLARTMGIPTVVSVRAERGGRSILGRLGERADDWEVFVSRYLQEAGPASRRRATVIYDGLDMRRWPRPNPSRGSSGIIRVGHLGMLTSWKGQDVFIQAAARVAAKYANVEFLVYGDPITTDARTYARSLRRMAEASGHGGRIHFMGFRPDVRQVLLGLDVLVHCPTSPEPFGMVVLEGMAAGVAVIASDEGGPREIARHGTDALLVRSRSAEDLADAIEYLIIHPDKRSALGKAARARVEETFSAEGTGEKMSRLYDELIQGRRVA